MANPQVPSGAPGIVNHTALINDLGGATPYATAGGAGASMAAGVVALEAAVGTYAGGSDVVTDLAAIITEVGDYTGGGGAEADVATGVIQAETDVAALETELGDYTGGGGAEADVATGVIQAETDITALQTDALSAQAFIPIGLNEIRLATGAALPAYSDGTDGLTLQDSEFFGIRFNDGVHTSMAVAVPMPPDLDETADVVVHALGARIGTADTDAALSVGAFFQTVGADYDADADAGGTSTAFSAAATKEVSEVTVTIAAANVPAAPCQLSLTIASHTTLDADDLVVGSLWIEYTRKLRTS